MRKGLSCYRCRWLLPIDRPPIELGWVQIHEGDIVALGGGAAPQPCEDLGDVAIMPGLVNAHTHLELSWMAGLVPPAASMDAWIGALLKIRRAGAPGGIAGELDAARRAASAMRESGTVLVGDISNSLMSAPVLAEAGLGGVLFHELLGFNAPDPALHLAQAWEKLEKVRTSNFELQTSVTAHAPYSVSPALFREIVEAPRHGPLAIHLAESREELEFLRSGRGAIRDMLETLGVWTDAWAIPKCDPLEYIAGLGYLRPGTLVVHGVHLTDANLRRIAEADAVIVTCPRSNSWVGSGAPPVSKFYASGAKVAIGTDSLASVATLSIFDELAELRRLAPDVAPSRLLESATRAGADALWRSTTHGTITPGKRAALIAVAVPSGTTDVEEYLVSGVDAGLVSYVGAS